MSQQRQPIDTPVTPGASPNEQETLPPEYVSFVLRCQTAPDGHIIARLLEVRSGTSTALTDLDALPALVRQWLQGQTGPPKG